MRDRNAERLNRIQLYIMNRKPMLNRDALFSDGTEDYCSPVEPEKFGKVTIRFRTAKNNVDTVFLVHQETRYPMEKEETRGIFDYYRVEIRLGADNFRYYFEIHAGNLVCYYNRCGVSRDLADYYSFSIAPGFRTPDWAKGAVMYQIYTDRFYNGDPSNDVEDREYIYIKEGTSRVRDWFKYPAVMGVREFYGGDLEGVRQKLDYLQELGVEVIYFNPLFVSPSNHKYDIQDYDFIDPHLGVVLHDGGDTLPEWDNDNSHAWKYIKRVTDLDNLKASNEFFIRLVEEIHRRGMKVILDGVFNHCGSFNKWMDRERIYENAEGFEKGAYVSAESPYRSFFKFMDGNAWPYNGSYDGWWGHDTLPKLNYEESPMLYEYIMEIGRKWVSPPFNVDGWRLDVAADLGHSNDFNHKFWKDFRKVVKEANPEALILAEHYGNAGDWLKGDEWDSVMNYDAFMEPLTWFLTGMEKHSDEYRQDLLGNAECFTGAMRHHMAGFLTPSLQVAMNELSNHDHSRFLTRTNHMVGRVGNLGPEAASVNVNPAVMREAVVMQMTWPGAPTVYYGDEAGVCGFTDPDNRRTYPWGREDQEMIRFHRLMIRIHKQYQALKTGSVMMLYEAFQVLAYARLDRRDSLIVAVNNSDHSVDIEVPVWKAEISNKNSMRSLMFTDYESFTAAPLIYEVKHGILSLHLPKNSAIVLERV